MKNMKTAATQGGIKEAFSVIAVAVKNHFIGNTEKSDGNGKFNGKVMFKGTQVDVRNGMARVMGEDFFVSDNGQIVVDKDRRFVGIIQKGTFIQATPEIIDQLKRQGMFEQ